VIGGLKLPGMPLGRGCAAGWAIGVRGEIREMREMFGGFGTNLTVLRIGGEIPEDFFVHFKIPGSLPGFHDYKKMAQEFSTTVCR
jgi:hypothetical protein